MTEKDVILTEEMDLCEGCGNDKPVVGKYRKRKKLHIIRRRLLERW